MKKIIVMALSVLFIVTAVQAQVTVDNPLDAKLEMNVNGQKLMLDPLQKDVMVRFIKPDRVTSFSFRWMINGKVKSQQIAKKISGSHWAISKNELMTGQPDVQVVVFSNSNAQNSDFNTSEPGIGRVNFIKNVNAKISKFYLTIKNNTSKDLIFIGNIFNGVALRPFDDAKSLGLVQPGLIEIAVLYQIADTSGMNSVAPSGQATAFSQQALSYMVVNQDQVIYISDRDLLNPASMTDQKIRFKNVGNVILYPSSDNKKLKALKPGQKSGVVRIQDLNDLAWYYNDPKTNMRRVAIFEIILGRTPIIEVRPMSNVYGAAKSQ